MTKFFKILKIVFVEQIVFFAFFMVTFIIPILPIILLGMYLIFHYVYSNLVCEKFNLKKGLFNFYYFISWILVLALIFVSLDTWLWDLLPGTGGFFLDGIQYAAMVLFLGLYLIVLYILKLIGFVISKIIKKINKN